MKLAKIFRVFLVIVLLVSVTPKPASRAADDDILRFLPAFIKTNCPCKFADLRALLQAKAEWCRKYFVLHSDFPALKQIQNYVETLEDSYPQNLPICGSSKNAVLMPTMVLNAQGGYEAVVRVRAEAYYLQGVQAVMDGSAPVALWCFTEAAWRYPHAPNFLNNAAFAMMEYGMYDDALKVLDCALTLAPDNSSAWVNKGVALGWKGRYGEAGRAFQKAFLNFPNNAQYCYLGAKAFQKAGMANDARGLAQVGKNNFPGYDWDGIINALPPPPTDPGGCPCSEQCYSFIAGGEICDQAKQAIENCYNSYFQQLYDYEKNVYGPASNANLQAYSSCDTSPQTKCAGQEQTYKSKNCYANYMGAQQGVEHRFLAFIEAWYADACKDLDKINSSYKLQLNQCQQSFIECEVNTRKWVFDGILSGRINVVSETVQELMRACNDLTEAYKCWRCCLAGADCLKCEGVIPGLPFLEWLLSGKFDFGAADLKLFCLTIFCLQSNADGSFSLQMKAGVAVKVKWNPFTSDVAINLGIGLGVGLGPLSLGGAVWWHFAGTDPNPSKRGVEAKIDLLVAKVKYFCTFENLSDKPFR